MNPEGEDLVTVRVAADRRGCTPQNIYGMFARGTVTDHRQKDIALGGNGSLRVSWRELDQVPRKPGKRPRASREHSGAGAGQDRSPGGPLDGKNSIQELRLQIEERLAVSERERDSATAELIAAADKYRALARQKVDLEHALALAEIQRDSASKARDAERAVRETYASVLAQEFGPGGVPVS